MVAAPLDGIALKPGLWNAAGDVHNERGAATRTFRVQQVLPGRRPPLWFRRPGDACCQTLLPDGVGAATATRTSWAPTQDLDR